MQYKKLSKDKFSQKVSFEAMTEFMNILSKYFLNVKTLRANKNLFDLNMYSNFKIFFLKRQIFFFTRDWQQFT